jgi:threonine synthase
MTKLVCTACGKEHDPSIAIWKCSCSGILDIETEPTFPIKEISNRKPTMWRYREALPINDDKNIITLDEGFTPLLELEVNNRPVLIKQEQLFSTGSYKDRGASVLVSKIKELGIDHVVEDSSGNAGCAIAAYCAKADIKCDIYVPYKTSIDKLAQLEFYGANIEKISGSREDTAKAVLKAAENYYYASHYWNPFFFHGTKTFAFEVCEQLDWNAPDVVVLPVGNGTLVLGAYIGFSELKKAGIINTLPRIIAVQAVNCAPLADAFLDGLTDLPEEPMVDYQDTIAEGIAIAEPARSKQIMAAVRETQGGFLTVTDNEIESALLDMGKRGFYIEPTSAATIAGLNKYLESSEDSEKIVSVFTGHGLKTTEKMLSVLK